MQNKSIVHSFDVFDTTLTRIWFKPTDLFVAVGRQLQREGLYDGPAESWAAAREKIERDLRRSLGGAAGETEEVGLLPIHDALAKFLAIDEAARDQALAIELALEAISIRPIARNCAAIAAARQSGSEVIFISDTYFDHGVVADFLRSTGLSIDSDMLYTSLALGRTKRTGTLYSHVLAERRIAADALRHTGDNLHSDIRSARRQGLNPVFYSAQQPNRYEKLLYDSAPKAPRLLRAAVAGAARAARLEQFYESPSHQVIAETGANVVGPLLTGFVLWVLSEAQKRKLKRLYFLARDGQVLLRIAQKLNDWLDWGLEIRYLYASRQSLFLPSLTYLDEFALDWILEKAGYKTLREILARLAMQPETESAELLAAGFPADSWDLTLGQEGLNKLKALLQRAEFGDRIMAEAAIHRANLLDYLTQEGVCDGSAYAIVDIGWKGRLQICLAKALNVMPSSSALPLIGFYYGLTQTPLPAVAGEGAAFADAPFTSPDLLETFCKADHGSVRRFLRTGAGRVEADLGAAIDGEAVEWGVREQQAGALRFVENLLIALRPSDVPIEQMINYLRRSGRDVFDRFVRFPSGAEADSYGMVQHANDQTHSDPALTAPRLAFPELIGLFSRFSHELYRRSIWPEGSIARSSSPVQRKILLVFWEVRRRVLRLLKRWRA